MGFLIKLFKILFVLILLLVSGCTKSIILEKVRSSQPGIFMYGNIPERNFYYPMDVSDSLKLKWITTTSGSYSNTSITIYDKYVFVPDLSGRVYCFDIGTGKEIGAEKYKGAVSIAPVLYRYRIFFLLNEYKEKYSRLIYYDYFTAKIISENLIYGNCNNEMIKTDEGVFVLSDVGRLYKFNYIGRQDWMTDTGELTFSSPAASNNVIVFGNIKGEIIGINLEDGSIKYQRKISDGFESGVTIFENVGYIGDSKGVLYSFDINNGNIIWTFDTRTKIKSNPVVNEKSVYVGNLKGDIYSLKKNTGDLIWETETNGLINTTPLLFNNFLIQPDLNKKVHFINSLTGEITYTMKFDGRVKMTPVYFEDTIYFGIDKGILYAYEFVN